MTIVLFGPGVIAAAVRMAKGRRKPDTSVQIDDTHAMTRFKILHVRSINPNMHDLPLNALRALAMIRRSGGIRAAARTLEISPSTINHHLRQLENAVGSALVEPNSRPLAFTAIGERLSKAALANIERLASDFDASSRVSRFDRVIIRSTQSFAMEWLLPRIGAFQAQHPHIEIWIDPDSRIDRADDRAALAIRSGKAMAAGEGAKPLLYEKLVPVASPDYWRSEPQSAEEVISHALIHDLDTHTSWLKFAHHYDIDKSRVEKGLRLGATSLTLEAAEKGLGVALAPETLATHRIERGSLSMLPQFTVEIGPTYWLATRSELRANEILVREWLLAEARSCSQAG